MQTQKSLQSSEQSLLLMAIIDCNLSIALADVINTSMMRFESTSNKLGKGLKFESKMRFKMLKDSASNLRKVSKEIARDGYMIKGANAFCETSDDLYSLLMLIVDRTGDDPKKMTKLKAMIYNMKSEMGIYE